MRGLWKARSEEAQSVGPKEYSKSFKAVSVRASNTGCEAARALSDKRFLVDEAPLLPLDGCDASVCDCRYRQHADRRVDSRRAADVGLGAPHFGGRERRSGSDRRKPETPNSSGQSYFDYFAR